MLLGALAGARPTPPADQRIFGSTHLAGFGRELAVGRFEGTSRPTLVIAAPFQPEGRDPRGRLHLFPCGAAGVDPGAARELPAPAGSFAFGLRLAAGDVTGDGLDDLLVGAQSSPDDTNAPALVHLFRGSPRGLGCASRWSATGDRSHEELGLPSLALGDVDGDGFADVAITGRHGHPELSLGVVRIHYGTVRGLSGSAAGVAWATAVAGRAGAPTVRSRSQRTSAAAVAAVPEAWAAGPCA